VMVVGWSSHLDAMSLAAGGIMQLSVKFAITLQVMQPVNTATCPYWCGCGCSTAAVVLAAAPPSKGLYYCR